MLRSSCGRSVEAAEGRRSGRRSAVPFSAASAFGSVIKAKKARSPLAAASLATASLAASSLAASSLAASCTFSSAASLSGRSMVEVASSAVTSESGRGREPMRCTSWCLFSRRTSVPASSKTRQPTRMPWRSAALPACTSEMSTPPPSASLSPSPRGPGPNSNRVGGTLGLATATPATAPAAAPATAPATAPAASPTAPNRDVRTDGIIGAAAAAFSRALWLAWARETRSLRSLKPRRAVRPDGDGRAGEGDGRASAMTVSARLRAASHAALASRARSASAWLRANSATCANLGCPLAWSAF